MLISPFYDSGIKSTDLISAPSPLSLLSIGKINSVLLLALKLVVDRQDLKIVNLSFVSVFIGFLAAFAFILCLF